MDYKNRYIATVALIAISFLVLLAQLSTLQIFSGKYKSQADQTTLFRKDLIPSRGMIFDRNEKLLIVNDPIYEINAVFNEIKKNFDTTLFCELLSIDKAEFRTLLDKDWKNLRFQKNLPVTFLSGIQMEDFLRFQEHLFRFPGFYPVLTFKRKYVYPNASHVLGYIGEVSPQSVSGNPGKYTQGDLIGVSGIEKVYDDYLRGMKGVAYVFRDNIGREIDSDSANPIEQRATAGGDIVTTLDIDLQAYGESLMANKKGSIVALEPETGEILTMVSSPTYDPNDLAIGRKRGEAFRRLQSDTINEPLLDRSVMAQYPPGSIFKPVLSLISLQEAVTYPGRTIKCTGVYEINKEKDYSQGCRNHPTPYNMTIALEHSCNTYYYKLMGETVDKFGYRKPGLGLAMINQYLDQFGMGRILQSDIYQEKEGFVPPPEYYDALYRDVSTGWRSTYILSLGIGQGELQMTTLQMANLAAILANRGYYRIPHLIKEYSRGDQMDARFVEKNEVKINKEFFVPVIEGMARVMITGTANRSRIRGIKSCGKTGTSQNPFGADHSVFFGFAPKDDPKIAVAVFVENAGGGGAVAAPIGSLIMEKHLKKDNPRPRKYLEGYVKGINLIPTS